MNPDHTAAPITVLCVDDSPDIVQMLQTLVGMQPDMTAIPGLHDAQEFMGVATALRPRVAILDLTMPGAITPIQAIRELSEHVPETRIIAYSGYDDPRTRDEVIEAGAWGLVSKDADLSVLINAIRTVAAGGVLT